VRSSKRAEHVTRDAHRRFLLLPAAEMQVCVCLSLYGAAAVVLLLIRIVNIMENKRRDKSQAADGLHVSSDELEADGALLDRTDFEQPNFRYII
jgi:hypothetical protein